MVDQYNLSVCELLVKSYLTSESQKRVVKNDDSVQIYYPQSRVALEDTWRGHLLFALRNEGVNLEVLKAFFQKIDQNAMLEFVKEHPTGSRHRRLWFLYESLTKTRLRISDAQRGNYVLLVDGRQQLAVPEENAVREKRYRVNNNLIGSVEFCPFVRLTDAIRSLPAEKLKDNANQLLGKYEPELIYRAVQYMFVKETRSSFAIERETPTQRRMEAFLSILREIRDGELTEAYLAELQNQIVDERYAQQSWRSDQVYVGETLTPGHERVHFIGVRPQDVDAIMKCFLRMVNKRVVEKDIDAVVLAAVASFAFVFIHPFDDGNGRLHRYLMHYVLSRLGFTPPQFIFPISAVLLKKTNEYDRMLETFSRRLMGAIKYEVDDNGEVSVIGESVDYYRYIDMTPIVGRFQRLIEETIQTEWKVELDYLKAYDVVRKRMKEIVDMPEKSVNQFIMFVRNNNGTLSKAKREKFSELTDFEVEALETIIRQEIGHLDGDDRGKAAGH